MNVKRNVKRRDMAHCGDKFHESCVTIECVNPEPQGSPTSLEVSFQLERMLRSQLFLSRPKQAVLLAYIVKSALSGKQIDAKDIVANVLPSTDPLGGNVRAIASYLRLSLDEYYETLGQDDLVIIALPPGPAYRISVSSNKRSKAITAYRRGVSRLVDFEHPVFDAWACFSQAIEADPQYVAAYESSAEVFLLQSILSDLQNVSLEATSSLGNAVHYAKRAIGLNAESPAAHLLLGISQIMSNDWTAAKCSIEIALRIDRPRVERNLWYAAYLVTIGELSGGLQIAKSRYALDPNDNSAALVFTLILYLKRDFKEAFAILNSMPELGYACHARNMVRNLLRLEVDELDHALSFFRNIKRRWEAEYKKPLRCITRVGSLYLGFSILCLAAQGKRDEALRQMKTFREEPMNGAFYIAIGLTAIGQGAEAVKALRRACRDGESLTLWLDLWPFLDKLRGVQEFEALLIEKRSYRPLTDPETEREPFKVVFDAVDRS